MNYEVVVNQQHQPDVEIHTTFIINKKEEASPFPLLHVHYLHFHSTNTSSRC